MFISQELSHPPRYDLLFSSTGSVRLCGEDAAQTVNSFAVGDHVIAGAFQAALPEKVSDLVDVALAVYITDRLCKRGAIREARYLHGWARQLHVTIPLRNPEFWMDPAIHSRLLRVLSYFTEDVWEFDFVPRPRVPRGAYQQSLFPEDLDGSIRVALFSGGLDSLAGLCSEIEAKRADTYVLFAGSTNFYHQGTQKYLASEVSHKAHARILPCVVPYRFSGRGPRAGNRDEASQRSRGFVHTALGAATAAMAGTDSLAIYENGVGAINLPYSGAQVGTHLTRAANPVGLSYMSEFLTAVLGSQFRVELPFLDRTKGEICCHLRNLGVEHLVAKTTSCDRFLRRAQHQCGVCTSCILRRQSLHAAGLESFDPGSTYFHDIYADVADALERKLFGFRMMVAQVDKLRTAVKSSSPWESLLLEFPQLFEVARQVERDRCFSGSAAEMLVGLYSRYCAEWDAFPPRPPRHRLYTLHEHGAF